MDQLLLVLLIMKDTFIPIISLVFSSFAFYVSFSDKKAKKLNLKIDQFEDFQEWEVDRESDDKPDVYHQQKYRLFTSVLLTNNSSLPVTITKFSISEIGYDLNAFTVIGEKYEITIKPGRYKMPRGGVAYSGTKIVKIIDFNKFPPQPIPITIAPYSSAITTLVFRNDVSVENRDIHLTVHTSRGDVTVNRPVVKSYASKLMTDYRPPQLEKFE